MLERLLKSLQGHIKEPSEVASWFLFFGGIAVCFGRALFAGEGMGEETDRVVAAHFFSEAGIFVVVFAAVYYLMGWWRERV